MIFIGAWIQDSCHKTMKSAQDRKRILSYEPDMMRKIKIEVLDQ